jgi:hypothetical protein
MMVKPPPEWVVTVGPEAAVAEPWDTIDGAASVVPPEDTFGAAAVFTAT